MSYASDLVEIRDNLASELATETAYRAANGPKPTYSVGGKNVDWNGYLRAMMDLIKEANENVLATGGDDGGLYEYHVRGYS